MSGFFGGGGGGGVGGGALLSSLVTPATGWQLSRCGLYLETAPRQVFDEGRSVGAADSEYGWTWTNRGNVDSADEGSTTSGALTITHTTSTDVLDASTRTAPTRVKTYKAYGHPQLWIAHIAGGGAAKISGIIVQESGAPGRLGRFGVKNTDSGDWYEGVGATNAAPTLTSGDQAAGIWVGVYRYKTEMRLLYISGQAFDSDTPPSLSDFTTAVTVANFFSSELVDCTVGFFALNVAGAATHVTEVRRFIDADAFPPGGVLVSTGDARPFGSTQTSTTARPQALPEIDLGSASASFTDADAQALAQALVNLRPWDAAPVTCRFTRGASGLSGSGSYVAPSVVTVGGSGRYLLPEFQYQLAAAGDSVASVYLGIPILSGS